MIYELYNRDELVLLGARNGDKEFQHTTELNKNMVHFYFCIEGHAVFSFGPSYTRNIESGNNYFLYNPKKDAPFSITMSPHTKMVFLTISLEHIHTLFLGDTLYFLKPENINQKFHDEREIPTSLIVVLNQLFMTDLEGATKQLYYHGKVLEILSLYFSEKKADTESCPFLNDKEIARKIKHAKEHLLNNPTPPLRLKELAKKVGLNEYQLKVGFKHTYGDTVFGFLLNRKLDHSHGLLNSGKYKVNEVAYSVGYSNPSHFIAAYKKKFGVTPKKYLMSRTP